MKRTFAGVLIALMVLMATPGRSEAVIHFGGSVGVIMPCVNTVIYVVLGPPNGGPYLWSPSVTKTYSFGPPSHSGQWLLGNAGPSYFCIQSILPLMVHSGLLMLMVGSSQ